ncbi:hypothetical protein V6N12_059159 [Hibiscus sabdariffa]|uniref:Uncharacterized protein n=1 Tax=Hibiscus sabdariffa TaxID=183260 RepID=A0ABR2EU83_9ROSI
MKDYRRFKWVAPKTQRFDGEEKSDFTLGRVNRLLGLQVLYNSNKKDSPFFLVPSHISLEFGRRDFIKA